MPSEEPLVPFRSGTLSYPRALSNKWPLVWRKALASWHKKREEANFLPFPEKY